MMWVSIALGGALGASLRHCLTLAIPSLPASGMPWATLAAKVLGSSLMGICFALLQRDSIGERIRGGDGRFAGLTYDVLCIQPATLRVN